MKWPLRTLIGPLFWAAAFSLIYAAHGLGCAWGWPAQPAPIADLQRFTLFALWLLALAGAGTILLLSPDGDSREETLVRAGAWIGFVSVTLTLFPVVGLTTCDAGS